MVSKVFGYIWLFAIQIFNVVFYTLCLLNNYGVSIYLCILGLITFSFGLGISIVFLVNDIHRNKKSNEITKESDSLTN